MARADGFPGERPAHRMRKRARSNPAVTCGGCRNFDGTAWCRRWNFATDAVSPICDEFRPLRADVPPLREPE